MTNQIRLDEDWCVRPEFGQDPGGVRRAVDLSEARRLTTICLVERVRRSSDWIREFVQTCRAAARGSTVDVRCGVEAKLLDTNGTLDAPISSAFTDFVFLSCTELPTPRGPLAAELARGQIAAGKLLPARAIEWLVRAAVAAVQGHDNAVLVYPFGLLPALGLDERHLHAPIVRWLASEMAARDARCVVDERLCSPRSSWVVECFLSAGVTVSPTRSESAQGVWGLAA